MRNILERIDEAVLILQHNDKFTYVSTYKQDYKMIGFALALSDNEDLREKAKISVTFLEDDKYQQYRYMPEYSDLTPNNKINSIREKLEDLIILENITDILKPYCKHKISSISFSKINKLDEDCSNKINENPWVVFENATPSKYYKYIPDPEKIPVIFFYDNVYYIDHIKKSDLSEKLGMKYRCIYDNRTLLANDITDYFPLKNNYCFTYEITNESKKVDHSLHVKKISSTTDAFFLHDGFITDDGDIMFDYLFGLYVFGMMPIFYKTSGKLFWLKYPIINDRIDYAAIESESTTFFSSPVYEGDANFIVNTPVSFQCLESESIELNGEIYDDCLKIELSSRAMEGEGKSTIWFCKNIGIIKAIGSNGWLFELKSHGYEDIHDKYNTTKESIATKNEKDFVQASINIAYDSIKEKYYIKRKKLFFTKKEYFSTREDAIQYINNNILA